MEWYGREKQRWGGGNASVQRENEERWERDGGKDEGRETEKQG